MLVSCTAQPETLVATYQHTAPILVAAERTVQLNRVEPKYESEPRSYDETFVQDLVFEHPQALPIDEIDTAYRGLVPICQELRTPAGNIDCLFVNRSGLLCIVECKLWRNPEARREVVAQILDYAKELGRWKYEDLQREVSKRLGQAGNVLYERVRDAHPGLAEADFVDAVARNLRRGRFLLLIIGDGIREG